MILANSKYKSRLIDVQNIDGFATISFLPNTDKYEIWAIEKMIEKGEPSAKSFKLEDGLVVNVEDEELKEVLEKIKFLKSMLGEA